MTDASTTPPGAGAPVTPAEMLDRDLDTLRDAFGADEERLEITRQMGQPVVRDALQKAGR